MKKKLLALLSAVASLTLLAGCGGGGNSTGGGSTDTGSTDTGSSTPCEHVYDNDCDADCNECGETRTPAEHSYTVANKDDTHHWNECACGAVDESSKAEHAYTEAKKNDTHHWNECACGAVDESSKVEHAFENACDTDCECGYEREIEHDYTAVPKGYFPAKEVVTGKYLLVADGLYMADALSESKNYGYLYSDENAPAEGAYKTVDETNVFTITKVDGGYTIQDTYGRYLYNTGTFNNFSLAAADAEVTEDHLWTIVIADDGTATITDVSTGKMVQQGEGTYTSYGVYAEKKDDTAMPVLYLYQEGNVKSDATDHWFTCNVCGEASAKEAHKGGEATCNEAAVCEVCGMSYGDPTGEHEYTVANKDAEYHWNECVCGEVDETSKVAHDYKEGRNYYDAESHWDECSCGAKANVTAHNIADGWKAADGYHVKGCADCNYNDESTKSEHTPKETPTDMTNGTHMTLCSICGWGLTEATAHEYTVANKDAEYHWNECVCGAAGEKEDRRGRKTSCSGTRATAGVGNKRTIRMKAAAD